jgi:hypothetical protein
LKEQPLKRGVLQGFRLQNARASAKLTEFCKRLNNMKQTQTECGAVKSNNTDTGVNEAR